MSRIEELIAELCPDGVEFEPIGAVVERPSTIRWGDAVEQEYQYIDLTSVDRITHAITETQTISSANAPSRAQQIVQEGDVIFGTTRPTLRRYAVIPAEYDGQIASTGYCVLRPRQDRILTNFLYHLLGTDRFYTFVEANQRGASYPGIPDEVVKQYRIPVPPLEVQREIVRILDLFTTLEAELEAELEARRRQYAHYRDSLLEFSPTTAQWVPIEELFELRNGYTPSKRRQEFWAGGTIPWFRMEDIRGGGRVLSDAVQHVTDEAVKNGGLFPANSLIVATSATIGEHALITVPFLCNQRFTVLTPKPEWVNRLLMKYVFYYGFRLARWCQENTKESSFASVDMTAFRRHHIPVPPLEEQRRIVEILDKFDALVNDLSSGLPAEIAARRKQYEYYRDRLLTFKEARV